MKVFQTLLFDFNIIKFHDLNVFFNWVNETGLSDMGLGLKKEIITLKK